MFLFNVFIVVFLVITTGCANLKNQLIEERKMIASGFIGCKPSEIDIKDNKQYTYTAVCKNKRFYCIVAPTASCKEEMK